MNPTELSFTYIQGEGIEIGAFVYPQPVNAKVTYVDRCTGEERHKRVPHAMGLTSFVPVDIIDNGETLGKIADNSQDFVIASHVFEHLKNPLLALQNWDRVLRQGGILYLAIPDKRYTAVDRERVCTAYEHLIEDYKAGVTIGEDEPDVHEHCWEQEGILTIILNFMRCYGYDVELLFKRQIDDTCGDTVVLLRKL